MSSWISKTPSMLSRAAQVLVAAGALAAGSARAAEVTWWVTDPGRAQAEAMVAEFQKANPGIAVKLQPVPNAGLEQKLLVALKSGNPPDIMEMQTSWIPSYQATGKLRDITAIVKGSGLDLKDFIPAALGAATVDGKIYGLPYQAEALSMFYNKNAFREVGLDPEKPPQTWTELLASAQKLTRTTANGTRLYGYGIAGGGPGGQSNTVYRSLPYIWMNGGDIVSADLKSSPINSPQAVEAVRFYTDMFLKHKVSPPSTLENGGLELRRLFQAGTVAMFQGTPTDFDVLMEQKVPFEVGVGITPHPDGKPSSALLGGWSIVASLEGPNKDGADKLVAFMANRDRIGFYTRTFPALVSSMSLPRFTDPRLKAFREMLEVARPQPNIDAWVRITDVFYRNLQEILIGGTDPKSGMDKAAAEIGKILQ